MRAVIAANARQSGIGWPAAPDDPAHLESVLSGDHPWTRPVEGFSPAGRALV